MANGWVKLHRSILDWQWWSDDNMLRLWLYLIITANTEDREWRNTTVKRGQLVTTVAELSEATNTSTQGIRTCLKRLEESGEINKQTTNKYTIITVCKFDTYQIKEEPTNKQSNKRITNEQQTNNKQTESSPRTPFKENKERKNKRIYYYSSSRVREEQEEKQFFFIFYLKGSADPSGEASDFISWNTTPERAAAWDRCPEYARYATARRWRVKGAKIDGYSDLAGRVLTALTDAFIRTAPDFLEIIYNRTRYPCQYSEKDRRVTLFCPERTRLILENDIDLTRSILHRLGVERLYYELQ